MTTNKAGNYQVWTNTNQYQVLFLMPGLRVLPQAALPPTTQ